MSLTEGVKEKIQSSVFARGGKIYYESIIVKNKWLTDRELKRLCDLYADYLGDWYAVWEEFEKIDMQREQQ